MKRQQLRYSLLFCLLLSAAFAAWAWFRPYAWQPDIAARCKVKETIVTPDASYFWVEVHLKVNPGMTHDLQKPVWLETASGKKLAPANTTLGGKDGEGTTEIWGKFWLESADLNGALTLHLNDGKLIIKGNQGIPQLENSTYRYFTTNQW